MTYQDPGTAFNRMSPFTCARMGGGDIGGAIMFKEALVRAKLCGGHTNCIDLALCSVIVSFCGKGDETSKSTTPPLKHNLTLYTPS